MQQLGTLYLNQTLTFKQKVYAGDQVTAKIVVESIQGRRVTFLTQCFKERNDHHN